MPFSRPVLHFFKTFIAVVSRQIPSAVLGRLLVSAHQGLQLRKSEWHNYAMLLRTLFTEFQWKIPPEDYATLARRIWDMPDPAPRVRLICCRDSITQTLARHYVQALYQQLPAEATKILLEIYQKMMGTKGSKLFRRLGVWIIEVGVPELPKDQHLCKAWDLVRGNRPPLKEPQQMQLPLPQPKLVVQAKRPESVNSDDLSEEEARQLEAKATSSKYEKLQANYDAMLKSCYETFLEDYGGSRQRPYMCIYDHPMLGKLFVMCSITGLNSKDQVVLANGKFGHSGKDEVVFKHWDSVIGTSDDKDAEGAETRIRALKYVEGGYGKYWINIKDNTRTQNDIFEAFFVLKNGKIVISKSAYDRRIRQARKNPPPTPAAPIPTFDITR